MAALPMDPPVHMGVESFMIPAGDARGLAGEKGLRVRQGRVVCAGEVIGFYRGNCFTQKARTGPGAVSSCALFIGFARCHLRLSVPGTLQVSEAACAGVRAKVCCLRASGVSQAQAAAAAWPQWGPGGAGVADPVRQVRCAPAQSCAPSPGNEGIDRSGRMELLFHGASAVGELGSGVSGACHTDWAGRVSLQLPRMS